jgi:hypothetical protein
MCESPIGAGCRSGTSARALAPFRSRVDWMPSALRSPDFESVSRRGVAALNALAAEFADGELTDDVCLACARCASAAVAPPSIRCLGRRNATQVIRARLAQDDVRLLSSWRITGGQVNPVAAV